MSLGSSAHCRPSTPAMPRSKTLDGIAPIIPPDGIKASPDHIRTALSGPPNTGREPWSGIL
jgi:hypothetical protein